MAPPAVASCARVMVGASVPGVFGVAMPVVGLMVQVVLIFSCEKNT